MPAVKLATLARYGMASKALVAALDGEGIGLQLRISVGGADSEVSDLVSTE